jgi:hypothetical protein
VRALSGVHGPLCAMWKVAAVAVAQTMIGAELARSFIREVLLPPAAGVVLTGSVLANSAAGAQVARSRSRCGARPPGDSPLRSLDGDVGLLRVSYVRVQSPEEAGGNHRPQVIVTDLA